MASGAGFAMDAIKRIRSNRALLKKKAPFQIQSENGFIKTTQKEYTYNKLSVGGLQKLRGKIKDYNEQETRKLYLRIVTSVFLAILSTIGVYQFLNWVF